MTKINSFKDLIVWQKAKQLAVEIYKLAEDFPKAELYGLTSQMRRCAISISSNIAESYHRRHATKKKQFLFIAYASATELESQLEVAKEIFNLTNSLQVESLLLEVLKMLNKIVNS
jgi:four helix bundle protein